MKPAQEPTELLKEAIEKLAVFAQPEAGRLEIDEKGSLIAPEPQKPLDRIINLARCYISPIFSEQAKQDQVKRLNRIKQEILKARDTLTSHSFLIEKLKEGNEQQQKLAQSALETIGRYNAIVLQDPFSLNPGYDTYNFERNTLLLDSEIKDQAIEVPSSFSIRFDSHSARSAQKTIKALSVSLDSHRAKISTFQSTHKKNDQFMTDTFQMKGIRMLEEHQALSLPLVEIRHLIKQTPIDIHEESELIIMQQLLSICPGYNITISGSFKRHHQTVKFMSMPVLDSFRLTSELTHTGSPYPSQHAGWSLSEKLVDALPLRSDQVPLFQFFQQRRKKLAHNLLHDPKCHAKSRHHYKRSKEIFDSKKIDLLSLRKKLALSVASEQMIDFFNVVNDSPSPFDLMTHVQELVNEHFIKRPALKLEETWLSGGKHPIRGGTSQEKYEAALKVLQDSHSQALQKYQGDDPIHQYVHSMGKVIGPAAHSIVLQYQSEKIGFQPPLLNTFEKKLQTCAFQQALAFIEEFEQPLAIDEAYFAQDLSSKCEMDLQIFNSRSVDDLDLVAANLTSSLEIYFNSRSKTRS